MKNLLNRRDFFRSIGVGTIGLGFGISIFDGIYQYAEALTEEEKSRFRNGHGHCGATTGNLQRKELIR